MAGAPALLCGLAADAKAGGDVGPGVTRPGLPFTRSGTPTSSGACSGGPGWQQSRWHGRTLDPLRCQRADTGAMTETESLIAEVRQLRADVARLHAAHTAVHIRHGWLKPLFKDLSTNPYTQYKVHMWGAIYWLIN